MTKRICFKYVATSFFVVLYFFSYLIAKFIDNNFLLAVSACFPIFILFSYFFDSKKYYVNKFSLFFLFVIFFLFIYSLLIENYKITRVFFNSFIFLSSWILAVHISSTQFLMKRIVTLLHYSYLLFCFTLLILAIMKGMLFHQYLGIISVGFSYNYISGYLVLMLSLYCSYFVKLKDKIPHGRINAIVVFLLCVLLFGRSGIFLSLLLLLSVFVYNSNKTERMFFIIFSVSLFFFVFYFHEILFEFILQTKFSEGLESPRHSMIKEYFSLLNVKTFLLGVNLFDMVTIEPYDYNPHNSFLLFHSNFGVFGLFLLYILLLLMFSQNNLWLIIFIFIYFLRGFFDVIILPGILDFILFSIILMVNSNSNSNSNFAPER